MKNWIAWRPLIVLLEKGELSLRTAEVLGEEIEQKTGIRLECSSLYLTGRSNIVLCTRDSFAALGKYADRLACLPPAGEEGFSLFTVPENGVERSVFIVGADERGLFFGMGKLLRLLFLRKSQLMIDDAQGAFTQTPDYPLRGHQLAYRDKQNTCPCWTQKDFDRYIRDLALFGTNAIEILPPRTDDTLFSRVFKAHPLDMMADLSRIIHSYGMDVWMWYPNMGADYHHPGTREDELRERERIFSAIPYLDAVLIPAGDPGHLELDLLFPVARESAAVLRRYHPKATVWLAPQAFAPCDHWYDDFYREVSKEPEWLDGLCYAPWVRDSIEEFKSRLPDKYKDRIRHYPDITHSLRCQFAVPDWDCAFQIMQGREVNNTRPLAMKHIHNLHAPFTCGSIAYSEGIHDDVNKFVWSQQDWDEKQDAQETLREYSRCFIDPLLENDLTKAFLALEENWASKEPIIKNTAVDKTYHLWMDIELKASEEVRRNYRFLMGLLRAISDYYVKYKQIYDNDIESQAVAIMKNAKHIGADPAMREAAAILRRGIDLPWSKSLRDRQLQLSDILHELCGIKLTTHHHEGQHFRRGAYLDLIDFPLNNQQYYTVSFKKIRELPDESQKLEAIEALLSRTNPGEGGFYINLGSPDSLKYIHFETSWEEDPGMLHSAHIGLCGQALNDAHLLTNTYKEVPIPKEWFMQAATYYQTPLILRIPGLDPKARYKLKMTYLQPGRSNHIRLTLGDGSVIHDTIEPRDYFDPSYQYPLPMGAYKDGTLELKWQAQGEAGGAWINEVFIERID